MGRKKPFQREVVPLGTSAIAFKKVRRNIMTNGHSHMEEPLGLDLVGFAMFFNPITSKPPNAICTGWGWPGLQVPPLRLSGCSVA